MTEITTVDALQTAGLHSYEAALQSQNRLNGEPVVVGGEQTTLAGVISAEAGGIAIEGAEPGTNPEAARFLVTGSDTLEIESSDVPSAEAETHVEEMKDESDTSEIDALLGPIVLEKPETRYFDYDPEEETKNATEFRQKIQTVYRQVKEAVQNGKREEAVQMCRELTYDELKDDQLLGVFASQGMIDIATEAAATPISEDSELSIKHLLRAAEKPIDARKDDASLEADATQAQAIVLASIEAVGVDTLSPYDKHDYLVAKFTSETIVTSDQALTETQPPKLKPLAEIAQTLTDVDRAFVDTLQLEHTLQQQPGEKQLTTEQTDKIKKLQQIINETKAQDTEGDYDVLLEDMNMRLVRTADDAGAYELVEEMLTNYNLDFTHVLSPLFTQLARNGHSKAILPLVEKNSWNQNMHTTALENILTSVAEAPTDSTPSGINTLAEALIASMDNLDDIDKKYASERLIPKLLELGLKEQAVTLLSNPNVSLTFADVSKFLTDTNDKEPIPTEIKKQLLNALLHSRAYNLSELVTTNEQIGTLCDELFSERINEMIQGNDPKEAEILLRELTNISEQLGRPLPPEVIDTANTELLQMFTQAFKDKTISNELFLTALEDIAKATDEKLGKALKYATLQSQSEDRSLDRIESILSLGGFQELSSGLKSSELDEFQTDSLMRKLGDGPVFDALIKRTLNSDQTMHESLKEYLGGAGGFDMFTQRNQMTKLYFEIFATDQRSWLTYDMSDDFFAQIIEGSVDLNTALDVMKQRQDFYDKYSINIDMDYIETVITRPDSRLEMDKIASRLKEYEPVLSELFPLRREDSDDVIWANRRLSGTLLKKIITTENPAEIVANIQKNKESMGVLGEYTSAFMTNEVLRDELVNTLISGEGIERFAKLHEVIEQNRDLLEKLSDPENIAHEFKEMFFTQLILSGGNATEIDKLRTVFLSDTIPVWAKLYTLVSLRYSEELRGDLITYPVTEIPLVRQPLGAQLDVTDVKNDQIEMRNLSTMSETELKRYLVEMRQGDLAQLVGNPIPFERIKPEYRPQIFAHYLRDAVERSSSETLKTVADARNRVLAKQTITVQKGTLLHSSDINALPKILSIGSLCGEALEVTHTRDMTPFQVDLALFAGQETTSGQEAIEHMSKTVQSEYGNFTFLFERSEDAKDADIVHADGPHVKRGQVLIIGGIAATEVTGIYFKNGTQRTKEGGIDIQVQKVKRQVVRNGFYIPLYDQDGSLIFTAEEFDDIQTRIQNPDTRSARIANLQEAATISPREFIDVLSDDPDLETQFAADSGVSEGYTLREHTEAILGQFEKNFGQSFNSPLLSRGAFRTMLALHDIGKAQGVAETGTTTAQHAYTVDFVQQKAASLGVSETEASIMTAVLEHDYLGEFIKGQTTIESTSNSIKEIANTLNVSASDVLDLIETYYLCDASSYTDDATYSSNAGTSQITAVPSINFVFDFTGEKIQLNEANRLKMQQLRSSL